MTPEEGDRAQRAHAQTTGLAAPLRPAAEGQQLTIDVCSERPSQFERVALAAAEQTRGAERCRSDMNDTHVSRRLADPR